MSPSHEAAAAFLSELGRCLSVITLYGPEHPTREAVEVSVLERLVALRSHDPCPTFTFLGDEVVVNRRPLREMRGWGWAARLSEAGIQRVEFPGTPTREELALFLEEASNRLTRKRGTRSDESDRADELHAGVVGGSIRYGRVGIGGTREDEEPARQMTLATLDFSLEEEFGALSWLQEEFKAGRGLHLAEAEAVVRSLAVAARSHQHVLQALLHPGALEGASGVLPGGADPSAHALDRHATAHGMNVAVLSMALAEFMGMDSRAVRAVGVAGLLHDLGTTRVPTEILAKPGRLNAEERSLVQRHPEHGARLILQNEERLDLAAVVAYEHHVRYDGSGYPRFRFPRPLHPVSHLVHVTATFNTLLSDRPWRARWEENEALDHLEARAGSEFHPEFAREFIQMIRLERRL